MVTNRRLNRFPVPPGKNSLCLWYRVVSPVRVTYNFLIIYINKYIPSLAVKRWLYRMAGVKVGKDVSFGLASMIDIFFPQLVTVGDNCVIGYNSTILCHEFLIKEYRTGEVVIGRDVVIGANSTILPGVYIGDGATVGAGSLVNRDVPPGALVAGVPAVLIQPLGLEE